MFAACAHAQVPVTPEQEAHSKLTPYQIARDRALAMCREQLLEQNVIPDQNPDALTACVQAAGVVEPTPLTTGAATSQ